MTETTDFSQYSDEELAAMCARDIEAAERELLDRYMKAIYWLPQRAYGADEEDLADFLVYAVDKIRDRQTFSLFDHTRGVKFTTWFGVVIRNLYFDYLRANSGTENEFAVSNDFLDEQVYNNESSPADSAEKEIENDEPSGAEKLFGQMQVRCRALFKMLAANSFFLSPDEIRWIAKTSGRDVLAVVTEFAQLEQKLCEQSADIEERHRKLATIFWWKRLYERRLYALEHEMNLPEWERTTRAEKMYEKLVRRQQQYEDMLHTLSGPAARASAPYAKLAEILRMNEGTLGSHLTRCRREMVKALSSEGDS